MLPPHAQRGQQAQRQTKRPHRFDPKWAPLQKNQAVNLVAGAGFEPTTFGL
jgi:hypothetical protein